MLVWTHRFSAYLFRPALPVPVASPKRILFIAIGNAPTVIAATAPLQFLQDRFSESEIGVVVSPQLAPLFERLPGVVAIFPTQGSERKNWYHPSFASIAPMQSFAPDWIVCATPNGALLADRIDARWKCGTTHEWIDWEHRSGFLQQAAAPDSMWQNWFPDALKPTPETAYRPRLPVSEPERVWGREQWQTTGKKPVLLLANASWKKYRTYWTNLLTRLQEEGYAPLLTVARKEATQIPDENCFLTDFDRFPRQLLAICSAADAIIASADLAAAIAVASGNPTARLGSAEPLWHDDNTHILAWHNDPDFDISETLHYLEVLFTPPPLPDPLPEKDDISDW